MTDTEILALHYKSSRGQIAHAEFAAALWKANVTPQRYARVLAKDTTRFLVKAGAVTAAIISAVVAATVVLLAA